MVRHERRLQDDGSPWSWPASACAAPLDRVMQWQKVGNSHRTMSSLTSCRQHKDLSVISLLVRITDETCQPVATWPAQPELTRLCSGSTSLPLALP